MRNVTRRRGQPLPENVVRLSDYQKPQHEAKPRAAGKSFYELYPMPFFDRKNLNAWAVKPTGDYITDLETGKQFAAQFLASCDMTIGWSTILPKIIMDMVRTGPQTSNGPDGTSQNNGVVIGFMIVVTSAAMYALHQRGLPDGGAA